MLIVPDAARPRWSGLDLRGALLATTSLGALVFALSQAQDAGWASMPTLGMGAAAWPAHRIRRRSSCAPSPCFASTASPTAAWAGDF